MAQNAYKDALNNSAVEKMAAAVAVTNKNPDGSDYVRKIQEINNNIIVLETRTVLTPTTSYANGNIMGTVLRFDNAALVAGRGGVILRGTTTSKKAGTNCIANLYLFDSPLVGTYSDNTTFAIAAADAAKAISWLDLTTGFSTLTRTSSTDAPAPYFCKADQHLYAVLVSRAPQSYNAADDVLIRLFVRMQ